MKHKPIKGILLDVGCRDRKQENFTGIDWREHPGVDIIHPLDKFPYPIDSDSCHTIKCAHVIEHIKPWLVMDFMNEMWRMLLPNGQLAISAPYAGSPGYWQDPTHCTPITERTWQHFDPKFPLYEQYRPKPWQIEHSVYKPDANVEAILRKVVPLDLSASMEIAVGAIKYGAMQKVSELTWFMELLRDKELKTIVEIGTGHGGVLWALCHASSKDALLVCIDNNAENVNLDKAITDCKHLKRTIIPLLKDSHLESTKKELVKVLMGKKIDLLFIDGDHSFEGVAKDWKMYSPLVKKGGMVAFHDICHHPPFTECHVDDFWNKVKKGKKVVELVDQNELNWGGIGVINL